VFVSVVAAHPLAKAHLEELTSKDRRISVLPLSLPSGVPPCGRLPDVVVVDEVGADPAWDCIRKLRLCLPQARIVLVGPGATNEGLVRKMFMGIHGYVTYEGARNGLVAAILGVSQGQVAVPAPVLQMYVSASSLALAERTKRASIITTREQEVIELLLRRLSNKGIAASLGISETTVKFHLTHVYEKLHVPDRRSLEEKVRHEEEAARSRERQGLAPLPEGQVSN
jgi:DNA-binding NarL/FixJ family response regulator